MKGWTDRATWLVATWIANDSNLYFPWKKRAKEVDTLALAIELEGYFGEQIPSDLAPFFQDLLHHVMGGVSWEEIAKDLQDG